MSYCLTALILVCCRYVLASDLGQRTDCCLLSGWFFKALLRSSLPHPAAYREYALYEVCTQPMWSN